MIDLLVIIVNWNGEGFIFECLESLQRAIKFSKKKVHAVCIDNASTDKSVEIIRSFPSVECITLPKNIGFAAANNMVLKTHDATYYLMLNPDTVMNDNENIDKMLSYLEDHREVGIAGCKLQNPDLTWQKSIGHFSTILSGFAEQTGLNHVAHNSRVIRQWGNYLSRIFKHNFSHFNVQMHNQSEPIDVDFIWGAYFLFRREVVQQIRMLDETFFIFGEESDFCLRAKKAGWKVQFVPVASVIHLGGQSRKQNLTRMYYWHIAVYFVFFSKHMPHKLFLWRIVTALIQTFLITKSWLSGNTRTYYIHLQLFRLSFVSRSDLPENLKNRWEMILENSRNNS